MRFAFIDAEKGSLSRRASVSRDGSESAMVFMHGSVAVRVSALVDSVLSAHGYGTAFQGSRRTYGSPRVRAELAGQGLHQHERRVRAPMRQSGLYVVPDERFTRTTDSKHALPIAPNLLARDFTASAPDRVWVTDITYSVDDAGLAVSGGDARLLCFRDAWSAGR